MKYFDVELYLHWFVHGIQGVFCLDDSYIFEGDRAETNDDLAMSIETLDSALYLFFKTELSSDSLLETPFLWLDLAYFLCLSLQSLNTDMAEWSISC